MPRYLIEVTHEAQEMACIRLLETFLSTGSHFLTNAEWGCMDGQHKAWFILEAEDREAARRVVPPNFRDQVRVVQLNKFNTQELDELRQAHGG
jgi:hypothetical protein